MSGPVDQFLVVDCLLPGQIRRLGTHVTYLTARRPSKTTAEDCVIRGGEYVAADRADYATALNVWIESAKAGDAEAQYYVGTIYEKGPTGKPDFLHAIAWYEKAADQGYGQAAMNLGRLYEKGLGVNKNAKEAFQWYARASGLDESGLSMLINEEAAGRIHALEATVSQREREIETLQGELDEVTQELTQLRSQLEQRTKETEEERRNLKRVEQQYQQVQADLQQAVLCDKGSPPVKTPQTVYRGSKRPLLSEGERSNTCGQANQEEAIARYETELGTLKGEVSSRQHKLERRDAEIALLQLRIETLQTQAENRVLDLEIAAAVDLGFEGPTIEILDPPLILTRDISVTQRHRISLSAHRRITGRVLAPAGLRSLRVNGQLTTTDENGIFTFDVPLLQSGKDGTPVDILAVDTQNKRAVNRLLITAQDTVTLDNRASPVDLTEFGRYYALVIGNDHYHHWNPLKNAVADATAVSQILQNRYGFEVTLLKDATRKDILTALNDFRKTLTPKAEISLAAAGQDSFLKVSLENVIVTNVTVGFSSGDARPIETVSLSYRKATWEWGTAKGGYDLAKNTKV